MMAFASAGQGHRRARVSSVARRDLRFAGFIDPGDVTHRKMTNDGPCPTSGRHKALSVSGNELHHLDIFIRIRMITVFVTRGRDTQFHAFMVAGGFLAACRRAGPLHQYLSPPACFCLLLLALRFFNGLRQQEILPCSQT